MKVIAHYHLDVEPSGKLGWLFILYKKHVLGFVLRHMDAVLVASEEQKRTVLRKYNVSEENIFQIENAVQDSFFQDRVITEPHNPLRILAVGRLTVQKRMDRIIEAMKHLTIPAELKIIGDGEDREELEKLKTKLSLENVTFLGMKTHEEIQTYHRWADIFVIPSEKEGGMPLVALEAMAAGLPVVGSDVSGVRDLLQGVGKLVNPVTPDEFAKTLSELYHNHEQLKLLTLKSSQKARNHTWKQANKGIVSVYEQVQLGEK
jgi:glycosyltransferase involved in cell wall biosynthesis